MKLMIVRGLCTRSILGIVIMIGLVMVASETCSADAFTKQDFDEAIGILRRGIEMAGHYRVLATVDKIIDHGDQSLPWLMALLEDKRTMGSVVITNRGEGHFEPFRQYSPTFVGDGARALLNDLTGFDDRTGLDGISASQRAKAIKKWQAWYEHYKDKLKWLPDNHEFEWKERKEPKTGKLSCSFPRSVWE
jgi:hypothetical protein